MKAKLLSLVLGLTMCFSLAACGTANEPANGNPPSTQSAGPTPSPSVEPTPAPTPSVILTLGQLVSDARTYTYTHTETGESVELSRKHYYYIPSAYQPGDKLPLVLSLHGSGNSALMQLGEGDWVRLAEEEGFIVVAPEAVAIHADGTISSEGKSMEEIGRYDGKFLRWHATSDDPQKNHGVDDVEYLCDLIDFFVDSGYADAGRVYSTGLSHGAFMAIRLALEVPQKIAGIGVAAGLLANEFSGCQVSEQVKLVFVHGTSDLIVPMNGMIYGDWVWALSLDDTIDWFMSQYGLSVSRIEKTSLPDLDPTDGCTMERWAYVDSNGNAPVVRFIVNGAGHTWPGGTQYMDAAFIGNVCMDAQAAQLIWNELNG